MPLSTVKVKRNTLRPRQEVLHDGRDWMVGANLKTETYLYRSQAGQKEFATTSDDEVELIVAKHFSDT